MRFKLLPINSCGLCLHFYSIRKTCYCDNQDVDRIITTDDIPEWCPLIDYTEEEEKK
jgi:hypothetical protein